MFIKFKHIACILAVLCVITLSLCISNTSQKAAPSINLQGKTIVIDPGHGGKDTGCAINSNIYEKDLNLQVARSLARMLQDKGAVVKFTRDRDYSPGKKFLFFNLKNRDSLDKRIETAVKNNADVFISLHVNSTLKKNRAGGIAFYNESNKLSQNLARSIQKELIKIPEMNKKTPRPRNYYLLNSLEIPSVVVEMGYASSERDRKNLATPEYREKISRALCSGIINYLDNNSNFYTHFTGTQPEIKKPQTASSASPGIFLLSTLKTRLLMSFEEIKTVTLEDNNTEDLARSTLEHLVNEHNQAEHLQECIPESISLNNLNLSGNLATVDLQVDGEKSGYPGSESEWMSVTSIAFTLFEFRDIQKVQILINGEKLKTLAGHIDISRPLTRDTLCVTRVQGGLMEGKKAKVAIVLDDFGQSNPTGVKEMMNMNRPLTFAVMPNLENSQKQAVQAAENGYEVIVHLPMQSLRGNPSWLGPGTISTGMTAEEIRGQVRKNFEQVPYATGFNNHMGDLITTREELIRPVLEVAREKEFFALDSRTSDKTQLAHLAQNMGVAYTQRNVFLDDVKTTTNIKKQLNFLAETALARGSAIGIVHVGWGGNKTALALKEMIPEMEAKGIEFIYLSELVH